MKHRRQFSFGRWRGATKFGGGSGAVGYPAMSKSGPGHYGYSVIRL